MGGKGESLNLLADVAERLIQAVGVKCEAIGSRLFSSPGAGEVRGSGMRGKLSHIASFAPSSDPSGHLLPGGEKNLPR